MREIEKGWKTEQEVRIYKDFVREEKETREGTLAEKYKLVERMERCEMKERMNRGVSCKKCIKDTRENLKRNTKNEVMEENEFKAKR